MRDGLDLLVGEGVLQLLELSLILFDVGEQFALFLFALIEFFDQGWRSSGVCDGVGEAIDLEFELGTLFVEFVEQGCGLCHGF